RSGAVDGAAKVNVFLDPRAAFGRGRVTGLSRHGDANHGDVWTGRSGSLWFRWTGAAKARPVDGGLGMTVRLAEGEEHDLVLEVADHEFTDEPPDAGQLWAATEEAWSQVAP